MLMVINSFLSGLISYMCFLPIKRTKEKKDAASCEVYWCIACCFDDHALVLNVLKIAMVSHLGGLEEKYRHLGELGFRECNQN